MTPSGEFRSFCLSRDPSKKSQSEALRVTGFGLRYGSKTAINVVMGYFQPGCCFSEMDMRHPVGSIMMHTKNIVARKDNGKRRLFAGDAATIDVYLNGPCCLRAMQDAAPNMIALDA